MIFAVHFSNHHTFLSIKIPIMKKSFYLLFLGLALTVAAKAQSSFSDDFESYTTSQTIALASPVWGTWGGNVAGEDAPISNEQAHSGTKSLKLYTTLAAGGPSDIILPFGGAHDAGDFQLDEWMYVVAGHGAYFNFQAEATVGTKWAADFFFDQSGVLSVNSDGNTTPVITNASFPVGTWFHLTVKVSLTSDLWQVFVNNSLVGSFHNTANKIASMDTYAYGPTGSVGWFYIDDVSYTYTPLVPKTLDAAMYYLSSRTVGLTGDNLPVQFTMRNIGSTTITSFDAMVDNGTASQTYSFTAQSIASLGVKTLTIPGSYTLIDGNQDVTITLSNINAGTDDDPSNNTSISTLKGYTPATGKHVLVEEATGTWCQWCPRGAVYMGLMNSRYPNHFVGVAVHNSTSDPMTVTAYDAGVTGTPGFSGFPSVILGRTDIYDPSGVEIPFLEAVTVPTPATLVNGATFDAASNTVTISVSATFNQSVPDGYSLSAAVIENSVKGTGSGYNQSNAYAGGASGVMGGFETKTNPVLASQMVYDEVARGLLSDYYGLPGSVPFGVTAGTKATANFTYTLTADNKYNNMEIVGILLDPNGAAVNAIKTTIDDAITNGFVLAANDVIADNNIEIAPNPASGLTNITLTLSKTAETTVRAFNSLGQLVGSRSYGALSGTQKLPFITSNLNNGVYNIEIIAGDQIIARKLVVNR
jgi:hypothetical protein